jgi:hypothetical protein
VDKKTKTCKKCKIKKNMSEFHKEGNNLTDGRRGSCIICEKKRLRLYKKKNNDLIKYNDRKKYLQMTDAERALHIKKKSAGNKKRWFSEKAIKTRREYSLSDKGIFNRYKADANRRSRRYDFCLSLKEFSNIISSICFYCGLENCRGADRMDNSLGYTLENTVPCCAQCNQMKNDYTISSWMSQMKKIIQYQKVKR